MLISAYLFNVQGLNYLCQQKQVHKYYYFEINIDTKLYSWGPPSAVTGYVVVLHTVRGNNVFIRS